MIAQYGLMSWDGFQESNPDVLDGESFILHLAFSDGKEVQAWGDNAFPDGYDEAAARVDAIFTQEEMAFLSGTYVYEGEGFGGDFTITLERDGTYCFYEGMLSSYLGAGQWTICDGAICMTEQSGMDASFLFRYEEAEEKDHLAIWYSARESDAFLYVSVPDGGRFVIHRGDAEEN